MQTAHFRLFAGTTADIDAARPRRIGSKPSTRASCGNLDVTRRPVDHGPHLARRDDLLQRADAVLRRALSAARLHHRSDGAAAARRAATCRSTSSTSSSMRRSMASTRASATTRAGSGKRWRFTKTASSSIRARSITCVRGMFPTLQQLNVDPNGGTQIYQLGYVLGEFIVSRWGRERVPAPDRNQRRPARRARRLRRRVRSRMAIVRAPAVSFLEHACPRR